MKKNILDRLKELYREFGYAPVPSQSGLPYTNTPMTLVKYDDKIDNYINRTEIHPRVLLVEEENINTITIKINSVPSKSKRYYFGNKCVMIERQDKVHDVGKDDPTNATLHYSVFRVGLHDTLLRPISFSMVVKSGSAMIEEYDAPGGSVTNVTLALWLLRRNCEIELLITYGDR